jgi:hypothetical protein
MKKYLIKFLLIGLLTAGAVPGWADIVIATGNNPQTDENVLFNETGLAQTGLTVQGITNNSGFIVDFEGTESLNTPSAGQARIEADDGGFTDLAISLNDPTASFTSLILNINLVNISGDGDGTVQFTVDQLVGPAFVGSFSVDEAGSNFFTITAINGQRITRVTLASTVEIRDIGDIRQIRIGGAGITDGEEPVIPEPATLSLIGLGLGTLGLIRRRCK